MSTMHYRTVSRVQVLQPSQSHTASSATDCKQSSLELDVKGLTTYPLVDPALHLITFSEEGKLADAVPQLPATCLQWRRVVSGVREG